MATEFLESDASRMWSTRTRATIEDLRGWLAAVVSSVRSAVSPFSVLRTGERLLPTRQAEGAQRAHNDYAVSEGDSPEH